MQLPSRLAVRYQKVPPVCKSEYLEEYNPEAPNVHFCAVSARGMVARNDLRRHVRRRATLFVVPPSVVLAFADEFGKAEVGEDRPPVLVDQDILWLDILVDDAKLPKGLKGSDLIGALKTEARNG